MSTLQQFTNDKHTREDVRAYLVEQLSKMAVQRTFNREDVSHIADAKDAIEAAFSALKAEYLPEEKKEQKNPAR